MIKETSEAFGQMLKHFRTYLPIQNPLATFVHNNILMMYEHLPFHHGVREAAFWYRGRPYREEAFYQNAYKEQRISDSDIKVAIQKLPKVMSDFCFPTFIQGDLVELIHQLLLTDHIRYRPRRAIQVTDLSLWNVLLDKIQSPLEFENITRGRLLLSDYWRDNYDEMTHDHTHPFLIRLLSCYFDQGMSFHPNPFWQKGLWRFFIFDLENSRHFGHPWLKLLWKKVHTHQMESRSFEEIIEKELGSLPLIKDLHQDFLQELLFSLKGWSGMVNKLELEPEQALIKSPDTSLLEYLTVLLLCEISVHEYFCEQKGLDPALIILGKSTRSFTPTEAALLLYELLSLWKKTDHEVKKYSSGELQDLLRFLLYFNRHHRLPLWMEAYEHHFHQEALSALYQHQKKVPLQSSDPKADILFCIDDREESIRRHVEELNPNLRTHGVVGFFGIDMKFAGLCRRNLSAQCPPVVVPRRIVREVALVPAETNHKIQGRRDMLGNLLLTSYYHSRTLFRGYFISLILGLVSFIPLGVKVVFPDMATRLRRKFMRVISPRPKTQLLIEQTDQKDEGYSKAEMGEIVYTILSMTECQNDFAPYVIMMSHGASSTNNPFKQAYGCGACGGNAGIPNSRAFVKMVNDPEVRRLVAQKGIIIPESTLFISAFHDTTADEILYFDQEHFSSIQKSDLEQIKKTLKEACARNAWERCHRFNSAMALRSFEHASLHVKERAEDLAQPRPEYGHNRVALAIVGKREISRSLYLARRSFLCSYDWEKDPEGTALAQVVIGSIPVTVNINMDYYFSHVDNDYYGAGSKLPLNVTSLLGVMTGAGSDLRIGLARQMIEIHEPMRILVVMQCPLERVQKLYHSHPRLKKMLYHFWMNLVVIDPITSLWWKFEAGEWINYLPDQMKTLPQFDTSIDLLKKVGTSIDFAEIHS